MNSNYLKKLAKYKHQLHAHLPVKWRYFLPRIFLFSVVIWALGIEKSQSHKLKLDNQSQNSTKAYLSDSSRSVSPGFFCTNNNALRVDDWSNPDLVARINQLNPSKIRFPGGTVANYWDWQNGGLIRAFREGKADFSRSFSVADRNYNASKLADFARGLKLTNTEPVFVLNMSTSDLESQLEMLRAAEDLGLAIEYIELGNELYINIPDNRDVFPQPQDYADEARIWISAIKQEFPTAKIAVVGVVPRPEKPLRVRAWNRSLIPQTLSEADAVVLHIYGGHGLGKQASQIPTYPFFTPEDTKTVLGQPFIRWQEVQSSPQFAILPKDKQIWITEYNLFESIFGKNKGKQPKIAGSWSHGLYAITMSLLFLSDPRVEFICNHQLVGSFYFASILPQADNFVDPITKLPLAKPYTLSATGAALSIFGDALEGMDRAVAIAFEHNYPALGLNQFEYPTLYGWMLMNQHQKNSLILNLSDQAKTIEVSSLYNEIASYETIFASPQDLITQPDSLKKITGISKGTVSLPPYSVTKISNNQL